MLKESVLKRQSCRSYSGKKVEREKLEQIIEVARFAPSARNTQPWKFFCVCEDEEVVDKVRKSVQPLGVNKFTDNATAFIVIVEQKPWFLLDKIERLKHRDFVSIDVGITTAHLVLAAEELGLSTCILGMFNEEKVKEAINFKKEDMVRLVVAVGYSSENDFIREKKRKDGTDLVEYL